MVEEQMRNRARLGLFYALASQIWTPLMSSAQTLIPFEALAPKGITVSKITLWRWERANRFPKRVTISRQRVAWIESEVDAFVASRIAARKTAERD